MRLHPFFFFFYFNFGLTRPFRPIQADTDRVGSILAASAPISAESAPTSAASARVGPIRDLPRGTTRSDVARTRGLRRPCRVPASRHVGCGCAGLGAASVHPSIYMQTFNVFIWDILFFPENCYSRESMLLQCGDTLVSKTTLGFGAYNDGLGGRHWEHINFMHVKKDS